MKHSSVILFFVLLTLCLTTPASAQAIYALPSGEGAGVIQVYSPTLTSTGSFPVPAIPYEFIAVPQGGKFISIAKSPTATVSFLTAPPGSSAARSLNLGAAPDVAVLTPDGSKLLVLAGALYIVDVQAESLPSTPLNLGAAPNDVAVSLDSRFAYVLSGASKRLTQVDLNTLNPSNRLENIGGTPTSVSVAPNGLVYVTTDGSILEVDPRTLAIRSNIQVSGARPGKLAFTPDGKYALATNQTLVGYSILLLDLPGRAIVQTAPLTSGGFPIGLDAITAVTNTRFLGYSGVSQLLYDISVPSLQVTQAGASGITQVAYSNEVAPRTLYYLANGSISSVDLTTNLPLNTVSTPGSAFVYASPASTSSPQSLITVTGSQTLTPTTTGQSAPLVVRVADAAGRPVVNAPVTFSSTDGTNLNVPAPRTNGQGYAFAYAVPPATAGTYSVTAAVTGTSLSTSFPIIVSATGGGGGGGGGGNGGGGNEFGTIKKISGEGQLFLPGTTMTSTIDPFILEATDTQGNPLVGVPVTWSVTDPAYNFIYNPQNITDENGRAQAFYVGAPNDVSLGTSFVQPVVTASLNNGLSADWTVTKLRAGAPPAIRYVSPANLPPSLTVKAGQSTPNGVQVEVVTSGGAGSIPGQAIPGVALKVRTQNDPASGPTASCEGPSLSNEQGLASCNVVGGGLVGSTAMIVSIGGIDLLSNVALTVNPGEAGKIVVVSGDAQSGNTGTLLPLPLIAQVQDLGGNALPNVSVTWEVVNAGTLTLVEPVSISDANGRVSTQVRVGSAAGTQQVRVRLVGTPTILATFNVTVNSQVAGISINGGANNPVVVVNQTYPTPLSVVVRNGAGGGVAGIPVTWAVTSGSATLSSTSTATDASGIAQVIATAGSTPGNITVSATIAGFSPVVFNLQSRLPGPAIDANSFRNLATGEAAIPAGSLAMITGNGLASSLNGAVTASLLNGTLPNQLGGVSINFGDIAAPIYQVANMNNMQWVIFQVPFELAPGTATAVVNVSGGSTTVQNVQVRAVGPGVLEDTDANGRRSAIVIGSDGRRITPSAPALKGERLRIYAVGLGQTNPAAATNRVGADNQNVVLPVTVGLNNAGVPVVSSRLAPNLVGVYEVIFEVPADTAGGTNVPLGFFIEATPGVPTFANGSVISIQ